MFPQQQATCTSGPSFPRLRPADTANIIHIDLIINVHFPKYPRMMKPLRIVLICTNIWQQILHFSIDELQQKIYKSLIHLEAQYSSLFMTIYNFHSSHHNILQEQFVLNL